MTSNRAEVFGGVDTHKDTHVAAVILPPLQPSKRAVDLIEYCHSRSSVSVSISHTPRVTRN